MNGYKVALVLTALLVTYSLKLGPISHAITITMEYSDEGSPVPHSENPSWDPAGIILKNHFQAAKLIWETLLPGPGNYQFDFHWDDDIGDTTLGLTTDLGLLDVFIEINPSVVNSMGTPLNWFADSTPGDHNEFAFSDTVDSMGQPLFSQRIYSQLSPSDQTTYFPGTAPPDGLETMYRGFGSSSFASASGLSGVNASNGIDLLSTIVHEIGHVLGIYGEEPGDYNISPQHVGGLQNLLVLEGGGGHLGGGPNVPGFLMCDSCGIPGVRRLPTATDILVIAEDQGISDVHLARVERISTGVWSDSNGWIGGDVPDPTQDVSIRHGGAVALDADAVAKNLLVASVNSVLVQSHQLTVNSSLNFGNALISVSSGGTIAANSITGDPASLVTTAGSLVHFNQFSRGSSSATSASFNGSVAIGYAASAPTPVMFDPNPITTWTVGEHLAVGSTNLTTLVLNAATWNVNGNVTVGLSALSGGPGSVVIKNISALTVGGNVDVLGTSTVASELIVETASQLEVAGNVTIGGNGFVKYSNPFPASAASFHILGGGTSVQGSPPVIPYHFESSPGGSLMLDGAYSNTETITVDGGVGNGAPNGLVTFKSIANASDTQFHVRAGKKGAYSPFLPLEIAGLGGRVRFEDTTSSATAHFHNYGVSEYQGSGGSGGVTEFFDDAKAGDAIFDNYGASYNTNAPSGHTEFNGSSTALRGQFINHPGWGLTPAGATNPNGGAGLTIFRGRSTAASGTFTNKGGDVAAALYFGGGTWFYDQSTAGNATFINEGAGAGLSHLPPYAASTRFYGTSSAGTATFYQLTAGSMTQFNDNSSAAEGTFVIKTGTGFGGFVVFNGYSRGGTADFTIEPNSYNAIIAFGDRNTALIDATNAEQSVITLEDNSNGRLEFTDNSSAGQANIDIGALGRVEFSGLNNGLATAANATIRLRPNGLGTFGFNSTAADSVITVEGAITAGGGVSGPWGALSFSYANAENSSITVEGGSFLGARGGDTTFDFTSSAGNATIVAKSPTVAGASGGVVTFRRGGNAPNARVTIEAGAWLDLTVNYYYGGTDIGLLEGAGTFILSGSELRTGGLNVDTVISGQLVDIAGSIPSGKLTKVGTGKLTLSGSNTFTGLTKVDAGTLAINGSIVGDAEVNSGGTLNGTGAIGGLVTVNYGGKLAPGNSPGTLSIGSLVMMPGSNLDFELGGTSPGSGYDQILSSGTLAFDGVLNVSLINGFAPAAGQSFNLFDWASVSGLFDNLNLPSLGVGLSWNTSQLYTTGVLSVGAGLSADFDNDGDVDGRDFLVWQRGGSPNGINSGDLALWQAGYGTPLIATSVAVPEPATGVLMSLTVAVGMLARRRRISSRVSRTH